MVFRIGGLGCGSGWGAAEVHLTQCTSDKQLPAVGDPAAVKHLSLVLKHQPPCTQTLQAASPRSRCHCRT